MILGACALLLSSSAGSALADVPITLEASLSERSAAVGDMLTLSITAVAHVDGSIEIEMPNIDGLTEVSRSKSEGTSISWSGSGQMITREYTLSIELEAQKPGSITIPAITARVGKNQAKTAPITVQVSGSGQAAEPADAAQPGRVEPPSATEQKLFIRYQVDRASAYLGQQILLDLDVYAAPSLNFGIEENAAPPTLDGFWKEIVDQPQRLNRRVEVVAGKSYHVYRLWRIALFPLEAGERTIPSAQLTFAVNRSIFGGGSRERRRTPPIKLDVKPLPAEGRPAAFSSTNVGAYKLEATVDHAKVPAGKAIVLQLQLSGRGNIKSARLPEAGTIPGFRVFDPTVSDNVNVQYDGITGEKKEEILLMPAAGGRLEIPSFELAIFNPETERYERLATTSIRVVVEGDPKALEATTPRDAPSLSPDPSANAREQPGDTPAPGKGLRPLRFRSALASHGEVPWRSTTFASLLAFPPVLFMLLTFGEVVVARARKETPGARRRAAARKARVRLQHAARAASTGDTALAYGQFYEALLDFATEKSGAPLRGMTTLEAKQALEARGAPEALVTRFVREMENADYARFAPGTRDSETLARSREQWELLLSDLETWSPKEDVG